MQTVLSNVNTLPVQTIYVVILVHFYHSLAVHLTTVFTMNEVDMYTWQKLLDAKYWFVHVCVPHNLQLFAIELKLIKIANFSLQWSMLVECPDLQAIEHVCSLKVLFENVVNFITDTHYYKQLHFCFVLLLFIVHM